jgi:pimeloyl-ACP methyl ester carboxylesterase
VICLRVHAIWSDADRRFQSSHQFRHLIPKLAAAGYHVIAPDLPAFGFTKVPENYVFTFDGIADAIESFIDTIGLKKFALYVFDYGAPTGFRIATRRPAAVTAIVSQNGNAFEDGISPAWAGFKAYWASGAQAERDAMRPFLTLDLTKFQYQTGEAEAHRIPPEAFTVDQYLLDNYSSRSHDNQLDLFYDYRKNVELYPTWHKYFSEHKPPLLAVWGKNDPLFIAPGAEAFKTVLPDAKVVFVDGGHFPLELHCDEISEAIVDFLKPLNLL